MLTSGHVLGFLFSRSRAFGAVGIWLSGYRVVFSKRMARSEIPNASMKLRAFGVYSGLWTCSQNAGIEPAFQALDQLNDLRTSTCKGTCSSSTLWVSVPRGPLQKSRLGGETEVARGT